jgi:hypothetical protein
MVRYDTVAMDGRGCGWLLHCIRLRYGTVREATAAGWVIKCRAVGGVFCSPSERHEIFEGEGMSWCAGKLLFVLNRDFDVRSGLVFCAFCQVWSVLRADVFPASESTRHHLHATRRISLGESVSTTYLMLFLSFLTDRD